MLYYKPDNDALSGSFPNWAAAGSPKWKCEAWPSFSGDPFPALDWSEMTGQKEKIEPKTLTLHAGLEGPLNTHYMNAKTLKLGKPQNHYSNFDRED